MFCLFYVSKCRMASEDIDRTIEAIVRLSQTRNSALGITGALLFSGSHFAQFLEGPEDHVRSVMRSITSDRRHSDVSVLLEEKSAAQRFESWSLAYSGPSSYVQRRLRPLLSAASVDREEAVWEMVALMREFTRSH